MATLALSRRRNETIQALVHRLLATDQHAVVPLIARVVLGAVMLPHATQKAFGWFGGQGFQPTVAAMTSTFGVPAPLAVLAIISELVGALCLITGAFARVGALLIAAIMIVAIAVVHLPNGFFMNWSGLQAGEGFEYHLLALALAAVVLVSGGGRYSVDAKLANAI